MECGCSCDWDPDVEPLKVYDGTWRKARKTYRCCECDEEIKPGDKYHEGCGLDDYGWTRWRTCKLCQSIRDDLCYCSPFGYLREELMEVLGMDYVTGEWFGKGAA
jgi:hypothetical protein